MLNLVITFVILINITVLYPQEIDSLKQNEWEALPIITYDTDAGFGYGGKAFLLSFLAWNESFDITLFNSTKGERWYRFKFSLPENEIRQGKEYDLAVDFIIDYDKWINYSFFGLGNNSLYKNEIKYTREPIDISLFFSRGFTSYIITEVGVRYNSTSNYKIPSGSFLSEMPGASNDRASIISLIFRFKYDTRKSYIHLLSGFVFQTEIENSVPISFTNTSLTRTGISVQNYVTFLFSNLIFANRILVNQLFGENIPVQYLASAGGNQTLRGYSQDRFLDKSSVLINSEFRFPVLWRIGGIAGIDAGNVWQSLSKMNFNNWAVNPVTGLRLYMDNFIVRADIGYSKETIGFYFNFGHIF